jgi:hypothetical protein
MCYSLNYCKLRILIQFYQELNNFHQAVWKLNVKYKENVFPTIEVYLVYMTAVYLKIVVIGDAMTYGFVHSIP